MVCGVGIIRFIHSTRQCCLFVELFLSEVKFEICKFDLSVTMWSSAMVFELDRDIDSCLVVPTV